MLNSIDQLRVLRNDTRMRTLTNDSRDFLLVNLGFAASGRGPYSIRQDGAPPGSLTQEEDRYFLRKDGTWVLNFVLYLDESKVPEFLYENIVEAHERILTLTGKPTVCDDVPEGTTKADIMRAMDSLNNKLTQAIRDRKPIQYQAP